MPASTEYLLRYGRAPRPPIGSRVVVFHHEHPGLDTHWTVTRWLKLGRVVVIRDAPRNRVYSTFSRPRRLKPGEE